MLEKTFQPESTIQEVKANLRQLYLQRLQDKLADRPPINIQCAYSLTGTDWDRAQIAYDDIVLEQKEVSTSLELIFDEHQGRLLVIGEPGAGKTSLLLQLADALLQRRENRVPVILNLATWNETYKNFEHWLLETLPRAGSVSKAYAKTLVLEDRLLPLFDGLDEVKAEHRQACLDAIAQYGRVAEHQLNVGAFLILSALVFYIFKLESGGAVLIMVQPFLAIRNASALSCITFIYVLMNVYDYAGGIYMCFFITFFIALIDAGLKKDPYVSIKSPFSLFNASLKWETAIILIFIIPQVSKYWLKEGQVSNYVILFLIMPILLPFYLFGRHLLLRLTMFIEKKLPLNLLTFLREMDARHIFESPGGSWRFRHKILQDYFIHEYERMEREQLLQN